MFLWDVDRDEQGCPNLPNSSDSHGLENPAPLAPSPGTFHDEAPLATIRAGGALSVLEG